MSKMQKMILKVKIEDPDRMGAALGTVALFKGVTSVKMDMVTNRMTVKGVEELDLASLISKVTKCGPPGSVLLLEKPPIDNKEKKKAEPKPATAMKEVNQNMKKENKKVEKKPAIDNKENKEKKKAEPKPATAMKEGNKNGKKAAEGNKNGKKAAIGKKEKKDDVKK